MGAVDEGGWEGTFNSTGMLNLGALEYISFLFRLFFLAFAFIDSGRLEITYSKGRFLPTVRAPPMKNS